MNTLAKVGVIGIGNMGSAHAACVAAGHIKGMALAAVCDIIPEKLEYCKQAFPGVRNLPMRAFCKTSPTPSSTMRNCWPPVSRVLTH